jgi:ubiquinone/menaquinone biosynthesis C-methylase UbiE
MERPRLAFAKGLKSKSGIFPPSLLLALCRSLKYDQGWLPLVAEELGMKPFGRPVLVVVLFLLAPSLAFSADPDKKADRKHPGYEYRENHDPNGIGKFYMGREIAQVMGHQAAEWLERPEREKEEQPSKLVEALKIQPGEVIADIGAGSGYYTFRLAPLVGPKGKVYAEDVQKEMIDIIEKRIKEKKVNNVKPILGTTTDPKLPAESVDRILLVDVYHEFDQPYEMTQALVKALKVGGQMVFVEFRTEDPAVPIKLVHKMSEKQVLKEMELHPLRWVKTLEVLPWQHIIIFEKKGEKDGAAKGKK